MLGVAFKTDRGLVTAIFQVCSGLLILHVSSRLHVHFCQGRIQGFPKGGGVGQARYEKRGGGGGVPSI